MRLDARWDANVDGICPIHDGGTARHQHDPWPRFRQPHGISIDHRVPES